MKCRYHILIVLFISVITAGSAQVNSPLEGRWNITMDFDGGEIPSWLEIRHSGNKTLVGRFVFATGSARPIAEVKYNGNQFSFSIPPQWESDNRNVEFKGELAGAQLKGSMTHTNGKTYTWVAEKAPTLPHIKIPRWGETVALFNGKDLSGWRAEENNQWVVENGVLKNPKIGVNLVSEQKFSNFKLHAEFRYPEGSNSGIYLRGRYEVQITDSHGSEPSDILFSGIYGFLTPNEMAAKPAGEWQSFDVILIGRRVTVIANGIPVILDQIIPGMTGGAIDNKEAEPGPFLLQGDHGPVEFRAFEVTPVIN